MTDYISREAAIEAVCENCNKIFPEEPCEPSDCTIMQMLHSIPSADVRPVVLCKDCKHRFMTPNGWHCPYAEWGIEDDDFCSCGEKREES